MTVLLVVFELHDDSTSRQRLLEALALYPSISFSESSCAISTTNSPRRVCDSLSALLGSNERLYVLTLDVPYWGFGSQAVHDWLSHNL